MLGILVDRLSRSRLDDLPSIHHQDVVADVLDDGQIVRDEQKESPSSSCKSLKRLTICPWTLTSSALTGSSQTINRGLMASARAIPMRCRWPPLNYADSVTPSPP